MTHDSDRPQPRTPAAPTIDRIAIRLGDVLTGPQTGPFSNGRVKGWSPCGQWLYVAWLGVVPTSSAAWCTDIEASQFARLYRPVESNRWQSEEIAWNFAPKKAPSLSTRGGGTYRGRYFSQSARHAAIAASIVPPYPWA